MAASRTPQNSNRLFHLAITVLSGPRAGEEWYLFEGEELILGRGKNAGFVIDDAKASRRHARFGNLGGELYVEDLGSVNGTFVNGERVDRRALFPGDAIEIAHVRFKADLKPLPEEDEPRPALDFGAGRSSTATLGNILASRLDTDKLRELLDFLEGRGRTGAVLVHTSWGTGKIYLNQGRLYHAEVERCPGISSRKALQRLLRAQDGSMEFSIGETSESPDTLAATLDEIVAEDEGFTERFARLESIMPSLDARLEIAGDARVPDSGAERNVFEVAERGGNVSDAMDAYPGSDTEVIRALIRLADQKVVRFTRGGLME